MASQLWLAIRLFPWRRHGKVAGNVLANLRSTIPRDGLKRPSWAERHMVPTDRLPDRQAAEQVPPDEELDAVLRWGPGRVDRSG